MNLKAFFRNTIYVFLLIVFSACNIQAQVKKSTHKKSEKSRLEEAIYLFEEGKHNYAAAFSILEGIEKDSQDVVAFYKARITENYDTAKALTYYTKAISLNSKYAKAYQYKGYLLAESRKYNEAVESLKKAIELKLENAEIYGRLGFSLARINKPAEAVTYLSKAISLDPVNLENYAHRAYTYIDLEQYDRAEQDYKLFLMKNPDDAIAWYNLSRAQYSQQKYEESITSLLKVNNLLPGYLDTYFWLGLSHAGKGDFTNALNWFDKAIEQKPNAGYLYFNRGIAKGRLNRNDFCPDFKKAVELGYTDAIKMTENYCK